MNNNIVYLSPENQSRIPVRLTGRQYSLDANSLPVDLHGLCGGFTCTPEHGGALPLHITGNDITAYIWDADCLPHISANRFAITHTSLDKPQITEQNGMHQISIVAGFDFVYTADQLPARLGIINLVESHCFASLKNGEQYSLRDSGEDQRMLHTQDTHSDGVTPILDTDCKSTPVAQHYVQTITHAIPEQIDGLDVDTMTILEQYTSYFMQRETPFSDSNIWTPVCAPIAWGWSIRIARRYDGDLGIARRKLFMPTVEHNGLAMPAW